MSKILQALKQSFVSLFRLRMILLVVLPPILAVICSVFLVYMVTQKWGEGFVSFLNSIDVLKWVVTTTGFQSMAPVAAMTILMLLFVPVTYLTAVIFTSVFVLPFVIKWVAEADFKGLEKKRGGSIRGSLWNTLLATLLFVIVFAVTLPLWFLPGIPFLMPVLLTSWLNKRVFLYDVLQDYATSEERQKIDKEESHNLYGMGILLGFCTYLPLMIFFVPVFSALTYTYYGLNELSRRRASSQP